MESQQLLDRVGRYLQPTDRTTVEQAYAYAAEAHDGKFRASGEPYVQHPLHVAAIIAEMSLDASALAAALLHDTVEDTTVTLEQIDSRFGGDVCRLVDGLTKLGKIQLAEVADKDSRENQAQTENLRKMFLAMVEDPRVVFIKLADRLHNMRTLSALDRDKQIRIARETMEIYAPLASRLGISEIKGELEDLAFRTLQPAKHRELEGAVARSGGSRAMYIEKVKNALKRKLSEEGVHAEIQGRQKRLYSIYRKMEHKDQPFDQIFDVVGIRVVTDEVMECYAALGAIHSLWRPIPGEFDDYINSPKQSMYQSLHTAVFAEEGRPLEIQIRTRQMHDLAENGIAAHWRYKESGQRDTGSEHRVAWLRQLLTWRDEISDSAEFLESIKNDVLQERIYVFTPKMDVIELPLGATPVDLAYRIHTDVGHRCVGAIVNERQVPLDHKLTTGDVVRIRTSKTKPGPSRDWLNPAQGYVATSSAREKIRQWFRRQERDENIAHGRDTLTKELKKLGLDQNKVEDVLQHFPAYQTLDDFLAAVGYGAVTPPQIANKLIVQEEKEILGTTQPERPTPTSLDVLVMGVGDLHRTLGRCCTPLLGDEIVGFVTRGRGVTIHRNTCPNVLHGDQDRLIPVTWGESGKQLYSVLINVVANDRVGLLRDLSSVVSDEKVNMHEIRTSHRKDHTATIEFLADVSDGEHLSRLLMKLDQMKDVTEVVRRAPKF